MLKRALLLLGETASSVAARRYALRVAQRTKAEVAGLAGVDLPYIKRAMPGRVGASGYKAKLEESLIQQADEVRRRVQDAFDAECRAQDIAFQRLSFDGDPIEALCAAAEIRDVVITGHDTAFRGDVREPLSEILSTLLSTTPRPLIVCPEELPAGENVLVAYDGSLPAMRAVQIFALLAVGIARPVQVISVDPSQDVAAARAAKAADYLRVHGHQVDVSPVVSRAKPTEALISEIAGRKIGTLVMGAYGHRGLRERLFGSTTSNLVERPPCALFLYH
jgi:nucleotide-binding universal stress UspA family protein